MFGDDFDPIINAAKSALKMQEIADAMCDDSAEGHVENMATAQDKLSAHKLCVDAWDKIGNYVTPKLKATEITGIDGDPLKIELVKYAAD